MTYSLQYPPEIRFGCNSAYELPGLLPPEGRILLLTGRSALSNGLVDKFKKILAKRIIIDASGMSIPEPTLECVDSIVDLGRSQKAEIVVAIGGGSCIDAAKAAAIVIPVGSANVSDFFNGARTVEKPGLFMAALPTTAGTGAEITSNAVLTDADLKIKKSIRSPFMVPNVAIIDPKLTISSPPSVTAASGMDAFTQALESFTSVAANATTRSLAKSAVAKIFANVATATSDGDDLFARTEMAEGSMLSAMAFSQSGLGAVHGLAHPIGSLLKLPHGKVCAILLPWVMRWNKTACEQEYAKLAKACDLNGTNELISAVEQLNTILEIPINFKSYGLSEAEIPFIVENCRSKSMTGNPRPMNDAEVSTFLNQLY